MLDKLPHYCPVCAYHEVRPAAARRACGGFVTPRAAPSPCAARAPCSACPLSARTALRQSSPTHPTRQPQWSPTGLVGLRLAVVGLRLTLPSLHITLRPPTVEPDGPGGDDLRVPQPHTHLHQAQGCAGRPLRGAGPRVLAAAGWPTGGACRGRTRPRAATLACTPLTGAHLLPAHPSPCARSPPRQAAGLAGPGGAVGRSLHRGGALPTNGPGEGPAWSLDERVAWARRRGCAWGSRAPSPAASC